MTYTTVPIQDFLVGTSPFDQLSPDVIQQLSEKCQLLRYRMGQTIGVRETMPDKIAILYEGQARLLGHAPQAPAPITLQLLKPGFVLGWASLVRGVPCETAIASTEAVCLTLKAADFLALLEQEPALAATFRNRCALIEVFDLLGAELERRANGAANLQELALKACSEAVVLNLPPGKTPLHSLDPNLVWLISGGAPTNFAVGSRLTPEDFQPYINVKGPGSARLVGLREPTRLLPNSTSTPTSSAVTPYEEIPYAPSAPPEPELERPAKYPYIHARGPMEATLACFQMLSQHWGMPFRRDVLRRALVNQFERTGSISLQLCGAIAELMSLNSQLVNVPAVAVSRLQAPAMLRWQDSFAILYKASVKELVLAIPESGIRRMKCADFIETWGQEGQVLLLQPTKDTPKQRFGLSWFNLTSRKSRSIIL